MSNIGESNLESGGEIAIGDEIGFALIMPVLARRSMMYFL